MKVYTSPFGSVPFADESVFTNLFVTRFHDHPVDLPAFIDGATGTTLTRGQLKSLSLSLAWGLRNRLAAIGGTPLSRGDTVMIFSPNSLAWPVALFGSVAAGLRITLANTSYVTRELEHQWTNSNAKVVFTHPDLLPLVTKLFEHLGLSDGEARRRIIIADWGTPAKDTMFVRMQDLIGKETLKEEEKFPGNQSNETLYLCYSSGTTGKPKGVETTHRNMTSQLAMLDVAYFKTKSPDDVTLGVLPFYHIYGVTKLLHFPFYRGLPVVIMPKFDPETFCAYIERYHITQALIVPPICVVLVQHPATAKYNLRSLRVLVSGAAPLGGALMLALRDKLKSFGVNIDITQGYGLTETTPVTHVLPLENTIEKAGSIGPLFPNLEARLVVDEDADKDAQDGEPGELWLRGPSVMKGYYNNPKATKDAMTADGWFKTGDIATRDAEGFYYIVDRRKELIKYKGFQVPPAELESVLLLHPEIADVAVIGVYVDKEATELPRAYVVPVKKFSSAQEKTAFEAGVRKWMESRVAKHKFLRGGVVVIDSIPKSAAGKILRRELRERAKQEAAAGKPKAKL